MKTIEISDEMYENLIEISKGLNEQDHLATRMPYIWTIKEKKQLWGHEDNNDGWELIDDRDSMSTGINDDSKKSDYYKYIRDNDLSDEWKKYRVENHRSYNEIEETLLEFFEENDYRRWYYQNVDTYTNFFLTRKACEDHIKQNHYHYNNPSPYLFHAWRNPEMEIVQSLLCEILCTTYHRKTT